MYPSTKPTTIHLVYFYHPLPSNRSPGTHIFTQIKKKANQPSPDSVFNLRPQPLSLPPPRAPNLPFHLPPRLPRALGATRSAPRLQRQHPHVHDRCGVGVGYTCAGVRGVCYRCAWKEGMESCSVPGWGSAEEEGEEDCSYC